MQFFTQRQRVFDVFQQWADTIGQVMFDVRQLSQCLLDLLQVSRAGALRADTRQQTLQVINFRQRVT